MGVNKHEFFNMIDLGLAYRKAKVDAYYSTSFKRSDFLSYEQDLITNLNRLAELLRSASNEINLGSWTLFPKDIINYEYVQGLIHSSPDDKWKAAIRSKRNEKPTAEFRLVAEPSVDFHVLSALWMLKAGHRYDAKLTECAYGNRLRRRGDETLNDLALGSFEPYLKPFRSWRDKGIRALDDTLRDGKKVVAVTADVCDFYHELNAGFMMNEDFLEAIKLTLTNDEKRLTRIFIQALETWAKKTPLKKGLPVGLPASGLIANMALIELDQTIEREVVPIYYGRYVDDIILVIEDASDFSTSEKVWEWLFARSDGLLRRADNDEHAIVFNPGYLSNCNIEFSNKKNKVFLLTGESGRAMVESIKNQVHKLSSEWRALPDIPENPRHIARAMIAATQKDGESVDNLRNADSLMFRRASFALTLRDIEAYERDLPHDAWVEHRREFLKTFIHHVLVLPTFFDLADYVPRVIRIATACEDFSLLSELLDRLFALVEQVSDSCNPNIKACPASQCPGSEVIISKWKSHLEETASDSIKAAFPYRISRSGSRCWREIIGGSEVLAKLLDINQTNKTLKAWQQELFFHDLAHLPFRFIGLPREFVGGYHLPAKRSITRYIDNTILLPPTITDGLNHVAKMMKLQRSMCLPMGLLFATRPFNLNELYLLHPSPYSTEGRKELIEAILSMRGFNIEKAMPCIEKDSLIRVPLEQNTSKYRIGLASWKTNIGSWLASVMQVPERDTSRYRRLTHLINEILASHTRMHYLVLPELSVPAQWFMRVAQKLRGKSISLICGVEYLHRRHKKVTNQVWAALLHDGLGFPSLAIYRQDKQRPSLHEEAELNRVAGLVLQPDSPWRTPPVICHGDFQFAILICSELTNIVYRSALRGRIDALFVPEWNQDTEAFNALVESSALDIHAFIIQCNDRKYGDSRIRAPYKDTWMRDLVRIKGGKNDYFVVGEIDVLALREFQSSHRSPSGPFKPVPDGFEITYNRRTLPSGETHE